MWKKFFFLEMKMKMNILNIPFEIRNDCVIFLLLFELHIHVVDCTFPCKIQSAEFRSAYGESWNQ